MHIIVDTNIIFSAILNPKGALSDIIFNYNVRKHKFYSCACLHYELDYLESRILKISKYSHQDFTVLKNLLLSQVKIIDEKLIPGSAVSKAKILTDDIDADDLFFVALAIYTKGYIWTGDHKLINGLKKKNFTRTLTTSDIKQIIF